jgi:hypothetical protein
VGDKGQRVFLSGCSVAAPFAGLGRRELEKKPAKEPALPAGLARWLAYQLTLTVGGWISISTLLRSTRTGSTMDAWRCSLGS